MSKLIDSPLWTNPASTEPMFPEAPPAAELAKILEDHREEIAERIRIRTAPYRTPGLPTWYLWV